MTLIDIKNPKSEFDFQAILIGNNKNILQLGNYPSNFSNFIKDNDCNVTIVTDDNDFFASHGNKKFDIILLGNIIERKIDHTTFLKKLSSMLEIDGYIVSSVSNISYISNRIQFLNNEFNFPENVSEFGACNLSDERVSEFAAPFVRESNVSIGVRYIRHFSIEENEVVMIIGSMEILVVNEDIIQDNGEVDLMHAQSIGVAGNNTYYNLNKFSSFDYIKKSQKNTLTDIVNREFKENTSSAK